MTTVDELIRLSNALGKDCYQPWYLIQCHFIAAGARNVRKLWPKTEKWLWLEYDRCLALTPGPLADV